MSLSLLRMAMSYDVSFGNMAGSTTTVSMPALRARLSA